MSHDDDTAERDRLASAVAARTDLPLVGLTWGTDGTWSARFWGRAAPFTYERIDAANVRVAGANQLALSFHPELHIDWRIHTIGPGRACLLCLGALLRSDVALDRDGLLDDPDYLRGLSPQDRERYNRRNVFPFSLSVAAHQSLHLAGMIAGSQRVAGIGSQHYAAFPGEMTATPTAPCKPSCEIAALTATAVPVVANPA